MHAPLLSSTTGLSIKQVTTQNSFDNWLVSKILRRMCSKDCSYISISFFILQIHGFSFRNKFWISDLLVKSTIIDSQRNKTANTPFSGMTFCPFTDWIVESFLPLMTLMTMVLILSTSLFLLWAVRSSVSEK